MRFNEANYPVYKLSRQYMHPGLDSIYRARQ